MSEDGAVFHLAIPCRDLDEAREFYEDRLGARLARRYEDRVTFEFFGSQLVCHLAPEHQDPAPDPYPRHFGATLRDRSAFDELVARIEASSLTYFREPSVRFAGRREEHRTFFLVDPSGNVVEFKHYADPEMIY